MPFQREGVQTNRDAVVIDRDRERLLARMRAFARGEAAARSCRRRAALRHYDPERARGAVRARSSATRMASWVDRPALAYRPFDTRWFVPVAPLCHRPRGALIAAIDHAEFAL